MKDYKTKLYNIWRGIKNRCYGEKTIQPHLYKDKGITVYIGWHQWNGFKEWALKNGYKDGLQIDRINNSLGYFPKNCRFVTPEQNANNRDVTFMVLYNGLTQPIKPLLKSLGKSENYYSIRMRILRGWNHQAAIDTPIKTGNYNYGNRHKVMDNILNLHTTEGLK